ncbi:hypothetical protein EYR38_010344 [Pleurotus pulmonarius]|nr:hypothetical protein EYR38_010344 [Pleurotus pulmonarius]
MSTADGHLDGVTTPDRACGVATAYTWLAIIFACTWTAIHPNIPAKEIRRREWSLRRWRLRQALWTLLVAELIVLWAVQQWVEARKVSQAHAKWTSDNGQHAHGGRRPQLRANAVDVEKNAGNTDIGHRTWTEVQSFFLIISWAASLPRPRMDPRSSTIAMSLAPSCAIPEGASPTPTVAQRPQHAHGPSESTTAEKEEVKVSVQHTYIHHGGRPPPSLTTPNPNPPFARLRIAKEEIPDKSKGDGLAKAIVVVQTLYFLIHAAAHLRPHRGLHPAGASASQHHSPHRTHHEWNGGFVLNVEPPQWDHRSSGTARARSPPRTRRRAGAVHEHHPPPPRHAQLVPCSSQRPRSAFGGVHCIAWTFASTTRAERIVWNVSAALVCNDQDVRERPGCAALRAGVCVGVCVVGV